MSCRTQKLVEFDLGLDLRHLQLETLALALAGEQRVEIALDQADLGLLLAAQRVDPHALDHRLRVGVEPQPAVVPERDLRGRARQRTDLLVLDQDRIELSVAPQQVLRLLPLDPALAVTQQRVGDGVALGKRRLQGGVGGDPGLAGELDRRLPVGGLALGQRHVVKPDRLADLLGSEQARPLLGRLLDQAQGLAQRPVGGGDLAGRDLELDPRPDVTGRKAVGLQDHCPKIGIAQMLRRQIPQALPFFNAHRQ